MTDTIAARPDMVADLKWQRTRDRVWAGDPPLRYTIYNPPWGFVVEMNGMKIPNSAVSHNSMEQARAAAQSDYAARIASALSPAFLERIAALEAENVTPRGGVKRNWWEEYQLLRRQFRKLEKAARLCLSEVDANLSKDDWPVKYRAPFEGLTKLRDALPETYEEFAAARATLQEHAEDGDKGDEG